MGKKRVGERESQLVVMGTKGKEHQKEMPCTLNSHLQKFLKREALLEFRV